MKFRNEYWFLSNMFPAEMKVNGLTFTCAEACFQSFKTTDLEERKRFQDLNGFEAKKLGRRISIRPNWNEIRLEVMYLVVKAKFRQHPELTDKLIRTCNRPNIEIVEDNTWGDKFWGRCNGIGENNLGKILTKIMTEALNN